MRLMSIASGSSGNCIYAGSGSTHILVDAGCSRKKIVEGLNRLDLTPDDVDAVFLTHEHSDHISGLKTLLKAYDIPVYATAGTFAGVREAGGKSACYADGSHWMDACDLYEVRADEEIVIGDITVDPFATSHDAADPVCYRLTNGTGSVAVATDMGCFDDYTVKHLQGVDALVLEANHDVRMLQTGSYPYRLKQRILGDRGHLSNDACSALLGRILHDNFKAVLLGHLSEQNNLPELAYETVRVGIEMNDTPYSASDFRMIVADRSTPSEVVEFR